MQYKSKAFTWNNFLQRNPKRKNFDIKKASQQNDLSTKIIQENPNYFKTFSAPQYLS